jgi:SARP family transcriptional regulator, regulator of embCAB operon
MLARSPCCHLGRTLATLAAVGAWIQLCGRVVVVLDGRRVEERLPGRQGRLLFTYLAVNRRRPATRDELIDALWPGEAPAGAETSLSALLSKLRSAFGAERLTGRSSLSLELGDDAWVDLEAASDALHRAESAVAREAWAEAWGPARVAQHIAKRRFLPGEDAPWIEEMRRDLEETYLRSLELAASASLGIGGSELDTAERTARALVKEAPYRESGHRLLMQALAVRGNSAEAVQVYERLRQLLRDELGVSPSAPTQALHRELIR